MDTPLQARTTPIAHSAARQKSLWARVFPYLLVAPTLILVSIFTIYPSIEAIIDSTYRPPLTVRQESEFVGLQNYADLFNPDHYIGTAFGKVFVNTLVFTLVTTLVSVPMGLGFALLLNRRMRGLGLWRFSFFYPALLPLIGAASIWSFIYADNIGLANTVLRSLGLGSVNWVGQIGMTLISVMIVVIWKQAGYFMIFYLAGLQGIPQDIYDAADMEGANHWQTLRYLTLPLLRRTTLFVLVIAFTYGFQMVEQLEALGLGGPNDSSNLMLYFIFQRIPEPRNWGYINAMTVMLVGIILVFTVSNFAFLEWRGKNETD